MPVLYEIRFKKKYFFFRFYDHGLLTVIVLIARSKYTILMLSSENTIRDTEQYFKLQPKLRIENMHCIINFQIRFTARN